MKNKIRHFYWNKYIISLFHSSKYYISYDFKHKAIWYRVYKVGTRTIDAQLRNNCNNKEYIYSSAVAYRSSMYKNYFKFAFVRNPIDRFISAWKDKVVRQNYFNFDDETHQKMKELNHFIDWVKMQNISKCDEHIKEQCSLIDMNNVNFIGRFESFDKDLMRVSQILGINYDKTIHKNKTKNIIQIQKVSEEEKTKIALLYEKDIMLFYPEETYRL